MNKKVKNVLIWIGVIVGFIAVILGIVTLLAWFMVRSAGEIDDITNANQSTIIDKNTGEIIREGIETGSNFYNAGTYIAHAMGGIGDVDYTNSYEALELNYELGTRIFEVDFLFTSDNDLVCCHDFDTIKQAGASKQNPPSLKKFLERPVYEKYTAMSAKDILLWLAEHKDVYVVTDTKEDLIAVTKRLVEIAYNLEDESGDYSASDILNRLDVQIYFAGQEEAVREIYPFENIIFTLYQRGFAKTNEDFESVVDYCKSNNIGGITMWASWWDSSYKEYKDAKDIGVFVHTVNDNGEAESLILSGVDKIYTDYLHQ